MILYFTATLPEKMSSPKHIPWRVIKIEAGFANSLITKI